MSSRCVQSGIVPRNNTAMGKECQQQSLLRLAFTLQPGRLLPWGILCGFPLLLPAGIHGPRLAPEILRGIVIPIAVPDSHDVVFIPGAWSLTLIAISMCSRIVPGRPILSEMMLLGCLADYL